MRRRELLLAAVAAAPVLVGRPAAAGAGRAPLALATADTEGFVAVVDLAAGRRVGRVATLDGPRSIEVRGRGPVVVAHTSGGAVTLLGRRGDRLVRRRVLRGSGGRPGGSWSSTSPPTRSARASCAGSRRRSSPTTSGSPRAAGASG